MKLLKAKRIALGISLALMLSLLLGWASTALAHTADDKLFHINHLNTVTGLGQLVGNLVSPILRIDNNGSGPALELEVQPGTSPMTVNSSTKVGSLNADQIDGQDSTAFVKEGSALKSKTYQVETPYSAGGGVANGSGKLTVWCNSGDVLLSGGVAGIDEGTILLESFPKDGSWNGRIKNDSTVDTFTVIALCADQ